MMETMIPPQVRMRHRTKINKRGLRRPNKKRKKRGHKKRKGPNKKMREKERRDNVTIILPHLFFKVAP